MKLIKPYFEILEQKPRNIIIPSDMEIGPKMARQEFIDTVYRQIEIAGRTCYKSEDKITPDSAAKFVERMVKSGHGAMLEHGTVYLYAPTEIYVNRLSGEVESDNPLEKYLDNPFSVANEDIDENGIEGIYVTTNYRVLVENKWLNDIKYLCEPNEHHERRITVRFVCDRGVSHEFVRHRVFSFAQESTRYCNYSRSKFNNELTFIIPNWLDWEEQTIHKGDFEKSGSGSEDSGIFINSLLDSESSYLNLIKEGWKPQEVRAVLPNSLKTELIMTGTLTQWEGFFKLRDAEGAHPQARELAEPLHAEFIKLGYLDA